MDPLLLGYILSIFGNQLEVGYPKHHRGEGLSPSAISSITTSGQHQLKQMWFTYQTPVLSDADTST